MAHRNLGRVLLLPLLLGVAFSPTFAQGEKKSSPEAIEDFRSAVRLLKGKHTEEAIQTLESLIQEHSEDPLAGRARDLLLDNGVGKDIRVVLQDRNVFRKKFKLPEKTVLSMVEKSLEELRPHYKLLKPFYRQSELKILFYDSQARYRKITGLITSSGNYKTLNQDFEKRALEGAIEWYFPTRGSIQDRKLDMTRLLYHENIHYLNAVHFGGVLPRLFEEGLATHFESRLVTDRYQTRQETPRDRIEGEARNGLNNINDYEQFVRLLGSDRGFGRGDAMIQRWYSFCYSVVDFLVEGEINSSRSSMKSLLQKLRRESQHRLEGATSQPERFAAQALLEEVLQEFFGSDLREFHRGLVQHILKSYKQR